MDEKHMIRCRICGDMKEISKETLEREHALNIESYGEEAGTPADTLNLICFCEDCK
jgi:hypothetical protein